ncbi:MAG: choline ABC transporter substrate-binding protein [Gammaproteobacteria bacterium]
MLSALLVFGVHLPAFAAEAESCKTPRFSNVGWTDTTTTTAVALVILEAIGYSPKEINLSIPVTYASMKNGDIDIYLGDWEPSMANDVGPYLETGDVEVLKPANLTGAKYTIAVPKYVADAGVRDFADIAKHADKFERKFYGLEPGDSGGGLILDMIAKNAFDLGEFELVESSEQGMLTQVTKRVKSGKWIAFLAWAPHPMNVNHDIVYLTGGDDYFGPNLGGAEIFTNVRRGYLSECENVGKFLHNLKFTLIIENTIMSAILDEEQEPKAAATAYMKANPEVVDRWLAGVRSHDGKDGRAAFRESLGF